MKNLLIVVFALTFSVSAYAKKSSYSKCMDAAQSTLDMNNCINAEYKRVDAKLNAIYKVVKQQMRENDQDYGSVGGLKGFEQRLIENERAWMVMRDTTCELYAAQMLGGTGMGPILGSCMISETNKRIGELKKIQDDFDNE